MAELLALTSALLITACGARTQVHECRRRDCQNLPINVSTPEVADVNELRPEVDAQASNNASDTAPAVTPSFSEPPPAPINPFTEPLLPSVPDAECANCSSGCTDLRVDDTHCGECGNACPAGTVCGGGRCRCDGGLSLCGNTCVDVASDVGNCGACGQACPSEAACQQGRCTCDAGEALCGGLCVNVASDANNCGGCGVVCGVGQE